jgi:hypothetical protein
VQHLILRPGPQLVMRKLRPEPDDPDARPNEIDVTDRANEFLFELLSLHAGATLAEIFRPQSLWGRQARRQNLTQCSAWRTLGSFPLSQVR